MGHLAILGASGHGKVVADAASLDANWETISFFDDAWPHVGAKMPWPVVGNTQDLLETLDQFHGVVIGIGDNAIRQQKHELLLKNKAKIVSIVHPQAYISRYAVIAPGCVVFAQAVININAYVGSNTIINTGATIDHDCHLCGYVHVSPGANLAGGVSVGKGSWMGIGSSVKQGVKIGSNVIVGAGSVVIEPIPDGQIVAGVPAKKL